MATDSQVLFEVMKALSFKSQLEFADAIGTSSSALSSMLNGKRPVSVATKRKIIAKYPELNPQYILRGEGSVLRSLQAVPHVGISAGMSAEGEGHYGGVLRGHVEVHKAVGSVSIRLLQGYASAGALGGDTPSGHTEGIMVVPFLPDTPDGYYAIKVSGDSMAPGIRHGAIVVLPARPAQPPLSDGSIYIIITQHICTLKRVRLSEAAGCYALHPDNTAHPVTTIPIGDIVQAWPVLWCMQEAI